MSATKRKCATCRFFQTSPISGQGWCTHPQRQTSSDVKILLRKDELACRDSWGSDLWVDAKAPDSQPAPRPAQPVADIILPIQKLSDEVTHVTTKDMPIVARDADQPDVIVQEASLFPEVTTPSEPATPDRDTNVAAYDDQAERARIMARGESDAVQHARSRMAQRQRRMVHLQRDPNLGTHSTPSHDITDIAPEREATKPEKPSRTPIEPVPPVPTDQVIASTSRTDRDRFDSIPEIKPDIELPRVVKTAASTPTTTPPTDEIVTEQPSAASTMSAYDAVWQRARQILREGKVTDDIETPAPVPVAKPRARRQPDPSARPEELPIATEPEVRTNERARMQRPVKPTPPVRPAIRASEAPIAPIAEPIVERRAAEPRVQAATPVDQPIARRAVAQRRPAPVAAPPKVTPQAPLQAEAPRASVSSVLARGISFQRAPREDDAPVTPIVDEPREAMTFASPDGQPSRRAQRVRQQAITPEITSEEPTPAAQLPDITFDDPIDEPIMGVPETPVPPKRSLFGRRRDVEPPREPIVAREEIAPARPIVQATRAVAPERPAEHQPMPATPTVASRPSMPPTPPVMRAAAQVEAALPAEDTRTFDLQDEAEFAAYRQRLFGTTRQEPRRPVITDRIVPDQRMTSRDINSPKTSPFRAGAFPEEARQPAPVDEPTRMEAMLDEPDDADLVEIENDFDLREVIANDIPAATLAYRIAPDIPRACRTCRDFRAAETPNGEAPSGRGWCVNSWAFAHRQMVNADELACKSTIGEWWLPKDSIWIPEEPQYQPTPRVAKLVTGREERRRSG